MRKFAILALLMVGVLSLSACQRPGQNVYRHDEVGKSSALSFGTILSVREVSVIGENTGAGALVGAAAGAGAGSYVGRGSGSAWGAGVGLVAGAIAGAMAEQAMADRKALEYVVVLESGVPMTYVQEIHKEDRVFAVGERVVVQNSGGYQRVLPASNLPTEVKRPQGLKIVD